MYLQQRDLNCIKKQAKQPIFSLQIDPRNKEVSITHTLYTLIGFFFMLFQRVISPFWVPMSHDCCDCFSHTTNINVTVQGSNSIMGHHLCHSTINQLCFIHNLNRSIGMENGIPSIIESYYHIQRKRHDHLVNSPSTWLHSDVQI